MTTQGLRPGNLDRQIATLLDGTTNDLAVWQDLARRFQVEIFCGLFLESFNEGLSLSASTLQLLGERSIALDLDMYSRGEDWSRNGPLPPRFDPADRIALGVARAKGARGRA